MVDENLKLAAYVMISSYRDKALHVLAKEDLLTPTTIAKKCDVRTNHISKTLSELKKTGLVVCINEEAKKGRLYSLTPLGKQVVKGVDLIKKGGGF